MILWRVGEDGIVACAWGTFVNGLVTLLVPLTGCSCAPTGAGAWRWTSARGFAELVRAAALPIVLQAFFVVCLRFASGLGTGAVTSFTYAYFVAAALVAVTASSLGMVSSVPLTRASLSDERASRHVVSTSLVSFAAVAAAAGVFALVGEQIIRAALGPAYEGDAGGRDRPPDRAARPLDGGVDRRHDHVPDALRRGPRAAAAAARDRGPDRRRPRSTWVAVDAFELDGAALALTVATLGVLVALLALLSPRVLAESGRRLALGAAAIGALALVSFAAPAWVLPDAAAAVVGVAAFGALLVAVRDSGPAAGVELPEDAGLDSPRAARPREAGARRRRADGGRQEPRQCRRPGRSGPEAVPERGALARVARRLRGSRLPLLLEPAQPRDRLAPARRGGAALPARAARPIRRRDRRDRPLQGRHDADARERASGRGPSSGRTTSTSRSAPT